MQSIHDLSQRQAERRAFLMAARRHGYTAAVLGLAGGYLFDGQAMAQSSADEERKQRAAKLTMLFATEYKIEDYVSTRSCRPGTRTISRPSPRARSTASCTPPANSASARPWRKKSRPARCTAVRCHCRTSRPTRRWLT